MADRSRKQAANDQQQSGIAAAAARNGFVWEVGNGLARTTVVTYLARELGADGTVVGFILAAPHLAGVTRLATPWLLSQMGERRTVALTMMAASSVVLMAVPVVSQPGFWTDERCTLGALSVGRGLWHLLLYLGVVALFAWFRGLVPATQLGAFLGVRERWKMLGVIFGSLAAGGFAWAWIATHPRHEHWWAYALPTFYGGVVMWASNWYLVDLPQRYAQADETDNASEFLPETSAHFFAPWSSAPFRRFLCFACWGAFANGLSQAAIGLFAPVALRLPVLILLVLETVMRLGQSAAAPAVGRWMDRHGNRRMLMGSQLVIAISLLFYFPTTKDEPFWIVGVYLFWIAYVGLNVGLYRTMLHLAPASKPAGHIAWYYASTGLAVGMGAIVGGIAFEWFPRDSAWRWEPVAGLALTRFQIFFAAGLILRTTAVWPLWNWRDVA